MFDFLLTMIPRYFLLNISEESFQFVKLVAALLIRPEVSSLANEMRNPIDYAILWKAILARDQVSVTATVILNTRYFLRYIPLFFSKKKAITITFHAMLEIIPSPGIIFGVQFKMSDFRWMLIGGNKSCLKKFEIFPFLA